MGKFELYYNTIIYLHSTQVWYQCVYRLRRIIRCFLGIKYDFSSYKKGNSLQLADFILKNESCDGNVFTFLNKSCDFSGYWDYKEYGALWSFNINYMDYLLQPSMSFDVGKMWIMRFIDGQESNIVGMSPYCISLRCVNWIKFLTKNRSLFNKEEEVKIDSSLFSQYKILANNIEYNLNGNHLLENFFSLLWGAFYFNDKKMYKLSRKGLIQSLEEQTLSDGSNYEQSPMYHCIILDRILDALNLLKNNSCFPDDELFEFLSLKAALMLGWIQSICYSDGTYPLFNDSVENVAPKVSELSEYARILGVNPISTTSNASGYYAVDTEKYELRIDMGGIAASYIPGHSHADTFNFELRVKKRPFIVDSAISTYDRCERREYERSTVAHNTVTVANENSSTVWAAFRCAQRAKVFDLKKDNNSISASHDGYAKYGVSHTRTFSWNDEFVDIKDTLSCDVCGKAYFHFIDSSVYFDGDRLVTLNGAVVFTNCMEIIIDDVKIATEYNRLQKCKRVCVVFKGFLHTRIYVNV